MKPLFGVRSGKQSTSLRFLCATDGKCKLVDLTKSLITEQALQSNATKFEPLFVHDQLQLLDNYPDPELVVLLGTTKCLFNLIPWQVRLSEIFSLELDANRAVYERNHFERDIRTKLVNVINEYARCEQRFGK